jgi:hypothetical protein
LFTNLWDLAEMLAALALALAADSFVPEDDLPLSFAGECIYPPKVVDAAASDTLVLCDAAVADEQGVEFRQRQWDAGTRFFGEWHGDQLRVTSIRPRAGDAVEARGQCRIYFANDAVSMISCTAIGAGRGWIANFRNVHP